MCSNTYTITPYAGGWKVSGLHENGQTLLYGAVMNVGPNLFTAHLGETPLGITERRKISGWYATVEYAARNLVKDYCKANGVLDIPLYDNTTKEAKVLSTQNKTMPSMQVIYDAHVVVDLHPDGSTTARVLLANYDDGPEVTDAEGRTLESRTVLHKAAWDAAAAVLLEDEYSLDIKVKNAAAE